MMTKDVMNTAMIWISTVIFKINMNNIVGYLGTYINRTEHLAVELGIHLQLRQFKTNQEVTSKSVKNLAWKLPETAVFQ